MRVGVEQGDLGPGRGLGLLDEVAGAGTDVEVSMSEMPTVALNRLRDGTPPHRARHEPEYPRVVYREHERVVAGLALVGGVVSIHRSPIYLLRVGAGSRRHLVQEVQDQANTQYPNIGKRP